VHGTASNVNPFSSDRFFFVMGQGWYFHAREGIKGPFTMRREAERALDVLKRGSRWHRATIWHPQQGMQ